MRCVLDRICSFAIAMLMCGFALSKQALRDIGAA